jgi:cell wall-associated NlpC family hydrolase
MSPDPRITAARPDLADEALRGMVAAARYVRPRPARIAAASAPLKREPHPDAPLDTEALRGEAVRVYEERDGWAWAQLAGDGYVGYLPADALGAADPAPTHRVAALRTFIYPAPDLKRPPVAALSFGAMLALSGEEEKGYSRLRDGGFVFAAHLVPLAAFEPDVAGTAERFVGAPYLWGGRTSLGLDCSALVQLSLARAGMAAPRDTDMQEAALGEPAAVAPNLSGLRRGDLVFWKGHVGLMLNPERLVHANGYHMAVAVEPLAEAEARIRAAGAGPITSVRRLFPLPAPDGRG